MLEIIERALLQALEDRAQVLVRGARAELVPARADAAFQHRRDAAEMMRDDLQVGIFVHDAGEHQPRHRRRGLVGPTQGPPDFVFRFLLAEIIGEIGGARRMHPDRLVEPFMAAKNGSNAGSSSGRPAMLVWICTPSAPFLIARVDFAHAGIGRGDRRLRHPAGEIIGIFLANLGEAVVHQLGVFLRQTPSPLAMTIRAAASDRTGSAHSRRTARRPSGARRDRGCWGFRARACRYRDGRFPRSC